MGQQKVLTYSGCVCSFRYPACNAHALYCNLRPVRLLSILLHYLTNGTIFWTDITGHIMRALILSTTFVWNISHSKKNWAKYNKFTYLDIHMNCPLLLSDFNETWKFSTDFRKIFKFQISWESVRWKPSFSFRTDGHDEQSLKSTYKQTTTHSIDKKYFLIRPRVFLSYTGTCHQSISVL